MQTHLPLAIIEAQVSLRDRLHQYLCAQPEFECVLTAGSVADFLRQLPAAGTPPVLVLCGLGLPAHPGTEGLPRLLARLPEAQVLLLSACTEAPGVLEALHVGAVGYLLKNTPLPDLKAHLLAVAAGGSPLAPAVARHVLRAFRRQPPVPVAPTPEARLTPREQQIVAAVEQGLSYKLVAEACNITVDTVKNHLRAVYRKLRINSKGELLALALKRRG